MRDVRGREPLVARQSQQRVEPRMRERAGRVELVGVLGEVEALAPAVREGIRIRGAGECGEHVVLALERRGRAAEAEPREARRRGAVARRDARRERARVLRRIVGPREQTGGLLQREPERDGLSRCIQSQKVAGGRGRAEDARDRARMKAAS